jgi:hypothetical protein
MDFIYQLCSISNKKLDRGLISLEEKRLENISEED